MLFTLSGKVTSVRCVHLQNAQSWMLVTPLGIITLPPLPVYFFSMPVSITKSSELCACAAVSSNLSQATVLAYLSI